MKRLFLAICAVGLLFTSCKKDSETSNPPEEEFAETLQDVTALYVSEGNTAGDTVVLYVQGGPVNELGTSDLDEFPMPNDYHKVYVHQAQTLNPSLTTDAISFDTAIHEDKRSAAILNKVIDHFKTQNKTVFVIGHSFGAFLTPYYIYKYGNKADKMAILAGRLDMPTVVWEAFRDGKQYNFPDGVTPTATTDTEEGVFEQIGANRLAAGFGHYRYTELLADKDLTKVLYMYSTKDIPVGSLSDAEDQFLKGKGATVVRIENGDHGSMFMSPYNQQIINYFKN